VLPPAPHGQHGNQPDPRRRFNATERAALYRFAGGHCPECDVELKPSWHADHRDPHSRGGPTAVPNGQALCPRCNLEKGARVAYRDTFTPRPAQAEVIDAVQRNVAEGRGQTVALLAPGSGKELLGQAVACHLYRMGIGDYVIVLTPRIGLAVQCETNWRAPVPGLARPRRNVLEDWTGHFEMFDPAGRIEFIEHIENRQPLLDPSVRARGIASTYQSLVTPAGQEAFASFAERHAGRFLLVVDEAQFCGDGEDGGGTRAGQMVKMLDHYAAHTLIMTGTAERSDGAPLVCCRYGTPNEKGVQPLLYDVRANYQDGVREGYLRRFVAQVTDTNVSRREVETGTRTVTSLSRDGANLGQVLRRPDVWQPLVDEVAQSVRDKKRRHPAYQGLISCMEKRDVENVAAYWRTRHPDLRVALATSEREDAQEVLRTFKTGGADVLVTVRMAFIGYDCKPITVVGVLTNYRDKGHLMQLVGRGMRVSDQEPFEKQSCRVIAPDDPQMQEFIEELREQSEQGIRDRGACGGPGSGGGTPPSTPTVVVEDTETIGTRAISADGALGHAEYAEVMALAREAGVTGDPHEVAEFARRVAERTRAAQRSTPPPPPPTAHPPAAPRTAKERIAHLCSETSAIIASSVVRECGVRPKEPGYQDAVTSQTIRLNKLAGGNAGDARKSEEFAQRRYDMAVRLFGDGQQQVLL
jgi:superfamily II DNA or RNA helicase